MNWARNRFNPVIVAVILVGSGSAKADEDPPDAAALARPFRVGGATAEYNRSLRWGPGVQEESTRAWFTVHGSAALRLQLRVTEAPAGDVKLLLETESGWRRSFSVAELAAAGGTVTTGRIPGESVQLFLSGDDQATAAVEIDRILYERPLEPSALTVFEGADWKPVVDYKFETGFDAASRAVALVRFARPNGDHVCTGSLVARDLLLTNAHCVADEETCKSAKITFGFEKDANGRESKGEEFSCAGVTKGPNGMDAVLLHLTGSPGESWGIVKVAAADAIAGDAGWLIGHPSGQPKMASRINCKVKSIPLYGVAGKKDHLGHLCDSDHGSSGSPLFNDRFEVVALHRVGFETSWEAKWHQNWAIRVSALSSLLALP